MFQNISGDYFKGSSMILWFKIMIVMIISIYGLVTNDIVVGEI